MNDLQTAQTTITEYRHWFANRFREIVPDNYTVIEQYRAEETPRRIARYLLTPGKINELFAGFTVEWMKSDIPRYYSGHFEPRWNGKGTIGRDDSYWEAREKHVLDGLNMVYATWKGVIKICRGKDSLYWCEGQCCDGNGWSDLHYLAFENRGFLEEFMDLLFKADSQECDQDRQHKVFCPNGRHIDLEEVALDRVVLPDELKSDIVSSTEVFFRRIETFRGVGVPSKRGFLFVGEPGNGKTLLCHALVNHVVKKFDVKVATIRVSANLDNDQIEKLYNWAGDHAPAIVLLEDIETVMTQTRVTRSGFLNILDGLKPERGVLTIATTNYPDQLDPALAHRPSRFDRVWRIPLPSDAERKVFLEKLFPSPLLTPELCELVVKRTRGWSMAYVQELKATAVVRAVQHDREQIAAGDIEEAVELLAKQFQSGRKNHRCEERAEPLGFSTA